MIILIRSTAMMRIKVELDPKYAENHTDAEISEALEAQLSYSLGFRAAEVKRFNCWVERIKV